MVKLKLEREEKEIGNSIYYVITTDATYVKSFYVNKYPTEEECKQEAQSHFDILLQKLKQGWKPYELLKEETI